MVRGQIRGKNNDISDRRRCAKSFRRSASGTRASGASISTIRPARRCRKAVADAVAKCLLETNANLGGFFATTLAAQAVVDDAHQAMADFLGATTPEEVIIGANMTTLTYQMSRTLGRGFAARRRDRRHPHGPRGQCLALAAACRGSRADGALPAVRHDQLAGRGGRPQRSCSASARGWWRSTMPAT